MTLIKNTYTNLARLIAALTIGLLGAVPNTHAQEITPADPIAAENQDSAVLGQLTNIAQKHANFTAPYSGDQSLSPRGRTEETTDATLFLGRRLWTGAELWLNPEIDQGYGLQGTLGVAGFPSGGAYKIGSNTPYLRFQKLFVRQTIALGGDVSTVEAGPNQLAGTSSADNLVVTAGKFSVTDVFDTNTYAHDTRADFLNWAIIDAGAYDYAADSWGYTWGTTAEWTEDWWTMRVGLFQLSPKPNGKIVRVNFGETSTNLEFEMRHDWNAHPGKIKLLAWINDGNMASYQDAVALGQKTNARPDVALVRRPGSRPGVVLNMEQELSADVGVFARLSASRGDKEAYEFTDINQSLSGGLSIKGDSWNRHDDTVGLAGVISRISGQAQTYFAAGGNGILIGDGNLRYAPEQIMEMYYAWQVSSAAVITADYQHVTNPAYNQDRGPVSIYGLRVHVNF